MWKEIAAKLIRWPLAQKLMRVMIWLVVPRTRMGVAVVAVNETFELLMVRHVFHPVYQWGLPGGWLNRNEAPAVGALRELREETGLTADLGPVVAVQHDPETAYVGVSYVATLHPGDIQLSHEIQEARWFAYDDLPEPITEHTRVAIEAAVAYCKNEKLGETSKA